jgi:hypothetical protein
MTSPFDWIKAISTGRNIMVDTENDELREKEYQAFMVTRGFSMYADTVLYAQCMNERSHLPNRLQHDFLINCIRPKSRRGWEKKDTDNLENLKMVAEYYQVGNRKAEEYLAVLSQESLAEIKRLSDRGGK